MSWIEFPFSHTSSSGKTKVWAVHSKENQSHLGTVSWYAPWRKYCFAPIAPSIFEWDCLREIATFCERATTLQKLKSTKA
jgi:hypothetical protein